MRNHWLQKSWKLEIRAIDPVTEADTFVPRDIEISRGPYRTKISSCAMQDLRDCCGISADQELACLTTQELEYGNRMTFPEEQGRHGVTINWGGRKKVQTLTIKEKQRIHVFFYLLRNEGLESAKRLMD